MKSSYDSSPLEWLFVAVLSYALGLVGQSWFSESELISGGWPWTTTGGFDTKNFVGLLLQTFLLPLSGVALLLFAAQTHKHASWPSAVKAALLGGAVAWAAVSAWLGWTRFGAPLLSAASSAASPPRATTTGTTVLDGAVHLRQRRALRRLALGRAPLRAAARRQRRPRALVGRRAAAARARRRRRRDQAAAAALRDPGARRARRRRRRARPPVAPDRRDHRGGRRVPRRRRRAAAVARGLGARLRRGARARAWRARARSSRRSGCCTRCACCSRRSSPTRG